MIEGFEIVVPTVRLGYVGLYRTLETLKLVEYYCKLLQNIEKIEMIVVDSMIAIGGIAKVQKYHHDVDIYGINRMNISWKSEK